MDVFLLCHCGPLCIHCEKMRNKYISIQNYSADNRVDKGEPLAFFSFFLDLDGFLDDLLLELYFSHSELSV